MASDFIQKAALTLDKSLSRAAEMFELTRGRVPIGSFIAAVYPQMAVDLLKQIREGIVFITGINGKTTTSNLLSTILRRSGKATLHTADTSGSFEDLVATLIQATSTHGRIRVDYGVFGVDDELLHDVLTFTSPKVLVLNNLYEDGIETEGGADAILREWRTLFNELSPDQILLINSDDPILCGGFVRGVPPRVVYFGVEDERLRIPSRAAELTRCLRCGGPIEYRLVAMSHLGDYRCDVCGWERPMPTVYAINVTIHPDSSQFRIITPSGPLDVTLRLPGVHNVYNAVAAAAAAISLGVNPASIRSGLEQSDPERGRGEQVVVNERHARFMLIKNPTSLNEAIRTALMMPPPHRLLFLIDDEIDSGGDVSWIWDADLELLSQRADSVVVSGSGADHLVLRFKHAGVEVTEIDADPDDAFHRAMADMPRKHHLNVLATDAALFELRRELGEVGVIRQFP